VIWGNAGTLFEGAGKSTGIAVSEQISKLEHSDRRISQVGLGKFMTHILKQIPKARAAGSQTPLQTSGMCTPALANSLEGTVTGANSMAKLAAQSLYYIEFLGARSRELLKMSLDQSVYLCIGGWNSGSKFSVGKH
jgi:hypothetical protein